MPADPPMLRKGKASVWAFLLLIAIVAVAAWVAYSHFMHSAPLPNFHW